MFVKGDGLKAQQGAEDRQIKRGGLKGEDGTSSKHLMAGPDWVIW